MATLQTLPPLAREYHADQRREIADVADEVRTRYLLTGPSFDAGWLTVGPAIVAATQAAQVGMVERADAYVPAILEQTGQTRSVPTLATPMSASLVGYSGSGVTVDETLSWAPVRAKQAVADGATARQALFSAADWLALSVTTILADTSRSAESLGMYARPVSGYIRMVNGGACGRCVVQAGRWFRKNQGFLRHPRCRCVHIPASEGIAGNWQTDPQAYFDSLDPAAQIKLMGGKANAQAVLDGADPRQIINAYRRTSGMRFAQESSIKRQTSFRGGVDKFTTEGTTRRGLAEMQQTALRRNGPTQLRLMPESIYRNATSQEDALRQLKLYGWIRDDAAVAQGRAVFAEQRRVARNARARERRAEAAWNAD